MKYNRHRRDFPHQWVEWCQLVIKQIAELSIVKAILLRKAVFVTVQESQIYFHVTTANRQVIALGFCPSGKPVPFKTAAYISLSVTTT